MNWIEYNEKLGLGFSDDKKFEMLKNNMISFISHSSLLRRSFCYSFMNFCFTTGTPYPSQIDDEYFIEILRRVFQYQCHNIKELVSNFVALVNSTDKDTEERNALVGFLKLQLHEIKICFEIFEENDSVYFFPNGANELDEALLAEPLDWLNDYPSSRMVFIRALKQYANSEHPRDVADNFRKSLEEFMHEFFKNKKNLDNNIAEVSMYLKSVGGSERIASIYKSILSSYNDINNECVKHNDKIDPMFLEFLMYQTGLFIRMLIVVRKSTGK